MLVESLAPGVRRHSPRRLILSWLPSYSHLGHKKPHCPHSLILHAIFFLPQHYRTIPQARTLDETEASLLKNAFLQDSNDNVRLPSQAHGFWMWQHISIIFFPLSLAALTADLCKIIRRRDPCCTAPQRCLQACPLALCRTSELQ